jgi:hypothetical protein
MQWSDRIGRRLKLRDLHILLAVAKAGSMGKAAAELAPLAIWPEVNGGSGSYSRLNWIESSRV